MKTTVLNLCIIASASVVLCGCGDSKSTASSNEETKPAATPAESAAPAAAAPAAAAANTAPAAPEKTAPLPPPAPVAVAVATASDATSQFLAAAKSQADTQLGAIGTELADKVNALEQTAGGNDAVKSQLDSSMQALTAGNDSGALASVYQAAQGASLTPQQTQLAKEVGNLASAYVVQKNFASLDGAQGDVATIVSSLRKGEIAPAVPALQRVGQNANLTPPQKQLVASVADKYAPGMMKAAGTVQQGLQGLESLRGTSK